MTKNRADTQRESNERRGVKPKGYNLKVEVIELIKALADERGIPQGQLIEDAVKAYAT